MNLKRLLINYAKKRSPDFIVGGRQNPYLHRWWLLPRNPFFNVYIHKFSRSDDDRALHDHMYANISWLLQGYYLEHTIQHGGIHTKTHVEAGDVVIRLSGKSAHRIELPDGKPCWTLFITGFRYREWGFHCPIRGWVHWKDFTDADDAGSIGRGCD